MTKTEVRMRRCPGSGKKSLRVHSSGAIMCDECNGAYLLSGLTVPDHEVPDRCSLGHEVDLRGRCIR